MIPSKYRQGNIGKPGLRKVLGDGISRIVSQTEAGEVYMISNDVDHTGISRDPGQRAPHMKVKSDADGVPLHKGKHRL